MKKILILLFFLLSKNVFAVEFKGKFIQGHFIIGKTESDTNILIDKKKSNKKKVQYSKNRWS